MVILCGWLLLCLGGFIGCSTRQNQSFETNNERIVIGYSMDTLREERWKRDRDAMIQKAQQLGVDLRILVANSNDARQIAQSKELVDQGVDVLIVAPHNAEVTSEIVEYAHSKGIPVLSYDRLIQNADVDAFVSVDHEQVGRQQAEYVTKIAPTGNYVYIGGAPTDSNVPLLRKGALEVLQPYIQQGQIQLVLDKMAEEWSPSLAREYMREALDKTNNNITAVIAANDNLAGAVNTALTEKGLQGKVLITGMDADLAALRRIVNGLQTMTVLKPIDPLTSTALEVAIALAKNQTVPANAVIYNGKTEVPSYLVQPVVVDQQNILDTIITPGYETFENIYK